MAMKENSTKQQKETVCGLCRWYKETFCYGMPPVPFPNGLVLRPTVFSKDKSCSLFLLRDEPK